MTLDDVSTEVRAVMVEVLRIANERVDLFQLETIREVLVNQRKEIAQEIVDGIFRRIIGKQVFQPTDDHSAEATACAVIAGDGEAIATAVPTTEVPPLPGLAP